MQRYFSLSNKEIVISSEDIHHITKVMRGKIGDCFELIFNDVVHILKITNLSPFSFEIVSKETQNNELEKQITLFYCLSKGDKNDLVIQKCTELGVNRIVFISSSRVVVRLSQNDFNKKLERYNKIAKEAAEQSKRNIIPEIIGLYDINKIPNELLCDYNYVAYEDISGKTNKTYDFFHEFQENGQSISVLIGPEGGLSKEEVDLLISKTFKTISLGKRILRTETAAIYVLSVLSFLLEANNG